MQERRSNPADCSHTATICVVEDDRSVRRALLRLLSSLGLHTIEFSSVPEVMGAPEHRQADCFLVDIHLGGEDGFRLLDLLAEEGHQAPVLLITGHRDRTVEQRARSSRAVDLLIKPFDDQTLVEALERCQLRPTPESETETSSNSGKRRWRE